MVENKNTNDNVSVEWKKHDQFYDSLNTKMDEISLVGEECYVKKDMVYVYFAKVKNLYNKHSAYIFETETIEKKLEKIEEQLYNPLFREDLGKGKSSAVSQIHRLFKNLQEVFKMMVQDFTAPELIPKPVKKQYEGYEEISSTKKKKMVKAAMGLFENV
jgi:hypothetical protein